LNKGRTSCCSTAHWFLPA